MRILLDDVAQVDGSFLGDCSNICYSYDPFGRIVEYRTTGGDKVDYFYNSEGQVVSEYCLGHVSKAQLAGILLFGKSYGPAPWYGEIEYQGRMSKAGFGQARSNPFLRIPTGVAGFHAFATFRHSELRTFRLCRRPSICNPPSFINLQIPLPATPFFSHLYKTKGGGTCPRFF
jgi:YD repeat-containing protein